MSEVKSSYFRDVYIVDGDRTPYLKVHNKMNPFSAADLAVEAGRNLLARQSFAIPDIEEVVVGCVMPSSEEANIARIIALRLGSPKATPAYTVQRNCASGMQALDSAAKDIAMGRYDLVLAGGTEAMSHAPLLYNQDMVNWLADFRSARDMKSRVKTALKFRPHYLSPVIALLNGLTDPLVGMIMGQTAENLAYRFNISREQMDEFAFNSHQKLAQAQDKGHLSEVKPLYSYKGQVYERDTGLRRDTTLEQLAKLKPIFDKKFGTVTAGNSSQVTDGSAMLILASEDAVKRYQLPVLGRIVDTQWAGVGPEEMGLGPVHATAKLLKQNQLTFDDIDYWEINEAFAAQVLACLAAWEDENYCRENLGLDHALGKLDQSRLNVDGGAIALGHPIGTSGARIVLHLCEVLKRNQAKLGIATICIGGGQGGAMLLENKER